MWGQLHNLTEGVKRRSGQKNCDRCGLLFKKILTECPRCSNINDEELSALLQQRAETRVGLGKTMFLSCGCILFIIFHYKFCCLRRNICMRS